MTCAAHPRLREGLTLKTMQTSPLPRPGRGHDHRHRQGQRKNQVRQDDRCPGHNGRASRQHPRRRGGGLPWGIGAAGRCSYCLKILGCATAPERGSGSHIKLSQQSPDPSALIVAETGQHDLVGRRVRLADPLGTNVVTFFMAAIRLIVFGIGDAVAVRQWTELGRRRCCGSPASDRGPR